MVIETWPQCKLVGLIQKKKHKRHTIVLLNYFIVFCLNKQKVVLICYHLLRNKTESSYSPAPLVVGECPFACSGETLLIGGDLESLELEAVGGVNLQTLLAFLSPLVEAGDMLRDEFPGKSRAVSWG